MTTFHFYRQQFGSISKHRWYFHNWSSSWKFLPMCIKRLENSTIQIPVSLIDASTSVTSPEDVTWSHKCRWKQTACGGRLCHVWQNPSCCCGNKTWIHRWVGRWTSLGLNLRVPFSLCSNVCTWTLRHAMCMFWYLCSCRWHFCRMVITRWRRFSLCEICVWRNSRIAVLRHCW